MLVGAEWGGIWEGYSLPSQLGGQWERRELSQRGPEPIPAGNGFQRILKATECSFLYLYDKIWGQFALAFPTPNSGEFVPRERAVIYAHKRGALACALGPSRACWGVT